MDSIKLDEGEKQIQASQNRPRCLQFHQISEYQIHKKVFATVHIGLLAC
jgi:hypothetical protein